MPKEIDDMEEIRPFNRYLLFYGPGEECTGLKGIRADAPPEAIEEFIRWYRDRNRYPNGRMRPKDVVIREMVYEVGEYVL